MSSYRKPVIKAFHAGADLSASQYCFVKFGSDDKTVVLSGAGDLACGILMNAPLSGDPAEVALPGGGALLKLGASQTKMLEMKSDGSGNGVVATSGDWVGAIVYQAGASGDIVEVLVVAQHKT